MQYRQIEIDVEVNRWLEGKRTSFDQTHNDILRAEAGLLSHSPRSAAAANLTSNGESGGAWTAKGATLPEGTRLRMSYNGKSFNGVIESGTWLVNGARYVSPSAAASALAGVSLNGWIYWEAQLPGTDRWQSISKFRSEIARRRSRK
ncbi:MAG: hypothetical protein ACREDL_07710 [Bradyrhizobium sp.]